jgi:hypothetical protein
MTKTMTFKNPDDQPIYLNLPGGGSLKIPARGEVEVDEAEVASVQQALQMIRGSVVMSESKAKGESAEAAAGEKAAAEGDKGGAPEQKPETRAESGSRPAGDAKKEEGGKDNA